MRGTTKNKIFLAIVVVLIFPVIGISVIMPRINFLTALAGNAKVKTDVYDVYFCDYSKDKEMDMNRLTLKILLEVRNGDPQNKLIIPRIQMDLGYLNKPVGKMWTTDEMILEPYTSEDSDSAGLLPMYLSLYLDEDKSGIEEFINGLLMGEVEAIKVNLTIYLGDAPIKLTILLGELLALFQGEDIGAGSFDIFSMLGLGGGDTSDRYRTPDNYIFLKKDDKAVDLRKLFSIDNASIFLNEYESLIFGAEEKFNSIYWVNGSRNNNAIGDGIYQWQYYNGTAWVNFSINSDGTNNFTKTGTIIFSEPSNWAKAELVDFFPEYYYIACKVKTQDSGENMTMNVLKSYVGSYSPLESSRIGYSSDIKPTKEEFPELDEDEIPLDKGFLKGLEEMSMEDYFEANGLNYTYILNDVLVASFLRGLGKLYTTEWIGETEPDSLEDLSDINIVLGKVQDFTYSHNVDFTQFLLLCEFDFLGILQYIGENFQGFTAPDGIDLITGENIYSPLYETGRYLNTIVFAYAVFIILLLGLVVITPYYASKRVDQSFIFREIRNLKSYMEEVRKEMEKGITEEEIKLLKTAVFKESDFIKKEKIDKESDKKE
ncbi:MAG: hypothetical protein ACP6IY_05340 [Promethearchaeia archaeon]